MFFSFTFLFVGLIMGSFLNSFIWRYQNKISFSGRSICPSCKKQIAWYDNIPLFSWVALGGRCRNCKKAISIQYPVVELLVGVLFFGAGLFIVPAQNIGQIIYKTEAGLSLDLIISSLILGSLLLIIFFLALIAVYDFRTKEIPNEFNFMFIGLAAIYTGLTQLPVSKFNCQIFAENILFSLTAAIAAFLFFWAFVYFSKETWMGGGDAKFAIGMGLLLGPSKILLAIMIASTIGSVYGATQILIQKNLQKSGKGAKLKKKISHEIPFGPFLALGTYISLLFGEQIISGYVRILLRF